MFAHSLKRKSLGWNPYVVTTADGVVEGQQDS